MKTRLPRLWATLTGCALAAVAAAAPPPDTIEQRIETLVQQMTLTEKLDVIAGDPATHVDTKPVDRLGVPRLAMSDGPHGLIRGQATCFPVGVNMAASWDPALVRQVGVALGEETIAKGRNVLLGPCINIHRLPQGGRNFESFSEDPHLTARMAVAYVRGVQETGVIATPKHYACNNQELNRKRIDVRVDERALREIYLPAFKAAVQEAHAWAVMGSYNRLNGQYVCESPRLLQHILKDEWGFRGFIVSDWGSVHSLIPTARAGLDVEMPYGQYYRAALLDEIRCLNVSFDVLNDKVRRVLRALAHQGWLDRPLAEPQESIDDPAHRQLAHRLAAESITLLKNEGALLPLDPARLRRVAVIGPHADVARLGGSGSSEVHPGRSVSPLQGLRDLLGDGVEVHHAVGCRLDSLDDFAAVPAAWLRPPGGNGDQHGLKAEFFRDPNLGGTPHATAVHDRIEHFWGWEEPVTGLGVRYFSVRWTGTLTVPESGSYRLAAISEEGSRLYLDGRLVIDNWAPHQVVTRVASLDLEAGRPYDVRFEFFDAGNYAIVKFGYQREETDPIAAAAALAARCDVAVVCAGVDKPFEGEGHDRTSLDLPGRQDELIAAVAAANPSTIVVLNNGTPVLMGDWIDRVAALVEAYYPGQEGGAALAEVLCGRVNPSGKLPMTFPRSWRQCAAYDHYPTDGRTVEFAEGVFVGYRYFDTYELDPQFPFGHGLSYTRFAYADLAVTVLPETSGSVRVDLTVTNTGSQAGAEVVQVYVGDVRASVPRPVRELRAFRKVFLEPGQARTVSFLLDETAWSFYDPARAAWVAESGAFDIAVGASSRDLRLRRTVTLALDD